MTNPEKVCECGHIKSSHSGGRGMCNALLASGYHCPVCRCTTFRARTPQFQRLQKLESTLRVALDFIEEIPDGVKTIKVWVPNREEKRALIEQINSALSFFPKAEA